MSLSDCIHCWDTPCTCGWDYRKYSNSFLQKRIDLLTKLKKFKEDNPDLTFSQSDFSPKTKGDEELIKFLRE